VNLELQIMQLYPDYKLTALVPSLASGAPSRGGADPPGLPEPAPVTFKLGVLLGSTWVPCTVEVTSTGPLLLEGMLSLTTPCATIKVGSTLGLHCRSHAAPEWPTMFS
jgi:hypothetical protein